MILISFVMAACSGRSETPVALADSTITYPSKDADDIQAQITLYRTQIRKTGKRIGVGTVFTIREKANIKAFIDLENLEKSKSLLMFHVDWIDPEGNSFYMKRIDIEPGDTATSLKSSISVEPGKREAGEYTFRVFLFRELIAEKKFRLIDEIPVTDADVKKVDAHVVLYKSLDKKTGERIGVDSVFMITKKSKVRAAVEMERLSIFNDRTLNFRFDWSDQNGKVVSTKSINLAPVDSTAILNSSMPVTNDECKPGTYLMRLYLFNFLLTEKKFQLKAEPGISLTKVEGVSAKITLCNKIDKKTGEKKGEGDEFVIGEKQKVVVLVEVENNSTGGDKEMKFRVEWIGPNGKDFYEKEESFAPDDPSPSIISSISITPDKRKPGKYGVRVFLDKKLIAEKKFLLKTD